MSKYDHLLWIDLETTGTEEQFDCIIEVGAILTDMDLNTIGEFTQIVRPTNHGAARLLKNTVVFKMHQDNGLVQDIQEYGDTLPTIQSVDLDLTERIKAAGAHPHKVMIAGSGVAHFDRRFIKAQMVMLEDMLAYPAFDIGVVRRVWEALTGQPSPAPLTQGDKTHRAGDDVAQHLEEARAFKALWGKFVERDFLARNQQQEGG